MALKTRAELVDEALANLGIIQQADTATPRTLSELINDAAYKVGVGAVGQTLSAEDYDAINVTAATVFADLHARAIATVSNPNSIPSAWFDALSGIVADLSKEGYGVTAEMSARLASNAQAGERKLANLTRTFIVDRNLDTILAELAVDEIVYLADTSAIPDEWFASLAAIVADRCKGKGFMLDAGTVQRVAIEGQLAVKTLRRITRGRPAYLVQQSSYF